MSDPESLFSPEPPNDPAAPPHALTVTQLTHAIKRLLEIEIGEVEVEGEISNWRPAASGHAYFTMKDEAAQISCVMFRGQRGRLKFEPEDGKQVLARGEISVYAPRGQYQLVVKSMEEKGLGDLHKRFLELKDKLEKEGLFDPARKRPIPYLPQRIGVVTSPTGAAIRDILNVLTRRFANLRVIICPALVQGDQAPPQIVRGIERFNELDNVDVILVARGGGSIEDLWCFNDERVARAIAASRLPVISAVGHEIDFTIADFAADLRAPTPSAAAELVSKDQAELGEKLAQLSRRLRRAALDQIGERRRHVEMLAASYGMRRPLDRVREFQQRLDDARRRGDRALRTLLHDRKQRLERNDAEQRHALRRLHDAQTARFERLAGRLNALNPKAVLERGYSVVYLLEPGEKRGQLREKLLRAPGEAKPHQKLRIQTARGDLPATANPPIQATQEDMFE
ncbi:exodeoxyribonuclease VII large subunit [Candidatus Sumerlaeota bacterium]|nr:exodeoxyribonuclease VII large subunit [Candidatus Sumerlaeota bacterium]